MKIHILPPDVVNRIAAGEVLDRPANLLKELLENSLDAGATQLDIEVEDGGRRVLVCDNGHGLAPEEMGLALLRHATSKISQSEDLFALQSFGFRGEALASVAAVSRLTLTSRAQGQTQGYRLISEFGQVSDPQPISAAPGTEIRVTDLFSNVPARLKFLKSDASEISQIKTTLKALALANERVGFSIKINGELVFHWPKNQDFQARAMAVLDKGQLFAGQSEVEGVRAEVLVSSPTDVANVNRSLWLFVQGRWIQDRSLVAAIMDGYRNLLMHGEYPTAVVRLTCPTGSVDVNVHPTKSQVKFSNSQAAFRATHRAVREVLEKSPWLQGETPLLPVQGEDSDPLRLSVQEPAPSNYQFQAREFDRTQYASKAFPVAQVRDAVQSFAPNESMNFLWANLQVLAQLNQTYILAQTQDVFYMVDQHAAHERVVFERLMAEFKAGKIEVQNLLLPLVLDFTAPEVEALLQHKSEIERLGLSIERMGPESLAVQAYPSVVNERAVAEALRRLAFEASESQGELAWEKAVAEIFASMACHSVVRAGQTLSVEEMKSLLVDMDKYPLSSFCPHGRPVFIKRRINDIEREFGRIV